MTTRRRVPPLQLRRFNRFEKKFENHYEKERHELETAITHLENLQKEGKLSTREMLARKARLTDKIMKIHADEASESHGMF